MLPSAKAWLPYELFGIHACICLGSRVVCGTKARTQRSRVDSRVRRLGWRGRLRKGDGGGGEEEQQRSLQRERHKGVGNGRLGANQHPPATAKLETAEGGWR
jgi:hypothetical protein